MVGIIVAGHGNFSSGIESVIKLIVGEQENIGFVDFLEEHSTEDLRKNIIDSIDRLDCDGYILFTDIPGGSPFKVSAEITMERDNFEVIAGTNMPMIMEILFDRNTNDVKSLKENAMETGKKQILTFDLNENKKKKEINTDDGI